MVNSNKSIIGFINLSFSACCFYIFKSNIACFKKNTFILPLLGVTLDTMLIGKDNIIDIVPVGFKYLIIDYDQEFFSER